MSDSSVAMNPTGGDNARHGLTQPALQVDLMQAVVAPENMRAAWARVKSNKGAPGIDGMPIEDFPAFARTHWATIRQALLDGCYRPQPVRWVLLSSREYKRQTGLEKMNGRGEAISEVLRVAPRYAHAISRPSAMGALLCRCA